MQVVGQLAALDAGAILVRIVIGPDAKFGGQSLTLIPCLNHRRSTDPVFRHHGSGHGSLRTAICACNAIVPSGGKSGLRNGTINSQS